MAHTCTHTIGAHLVRFWEAKSCSSAGAHDKFSGSYSFLFMESKNIIRIFTLLVLMRCSQAEESTTSSIPKISDMHAFTLVVSHLSDAILPCFSPELSDISVFRYVWLRNGKELGHDSKGPKSVIQTGGGTLLVQNATADDSGVYSCQVFTERGIMELNVTLVVLEAEKPPSFGSFSPFPRSATHKKIGSSMEFHCAVEGIPKPSLEWFRNDVPITKMNFTHVVTEITRTSLILKNLSIEDSANYSCQASNRLGTVNAIFSLEVSDSSHPDLTFFHPLNTTVKSGSSATFRCRVKSSEATPNIQWLKRIDDTTVCKDEPNVLKVQGENYRVLRTSQMVKRADGSYLNKFVIPEAKEKDSGKYICLGANKMGYSFRSAYLTVLPGSRAVTGWSHHVSAHPGESGSLRLAFPTVGGGLGIALAIAVVGAFYFLCRRRTRAGRSNTMHLPSSASIEMDALNMDSPYFAGGKSPLIVATSPVLSEVELCGGSSTVTKVYNSNENFYKLRDEV